MNPPLFVRCALCGRVELPDLVNRDADPFVITCGGCGSKIRVTIKIKAEYLSDIERDYPELKNMDGPPRDRMLRRAERTK